MANQFTAQIELDIEIGAGYIPDGVIERRRVERQVSAQVQRELNGMLINADARDRIREALGVGDDFDLRLSATVRHSTLREVALST